MMQELEDSKPFKAYELTATIRVRLLEPNEATARKTLELRLGKTKCFTAMDIDITEVSESMSGVV